MRKQSKSPSESVEESRRPAISQEAREQQMIALAINLAEKQLMEGTASAQVITHYLKLGSSREKLEKEMLEQQKELAAAKRKNYELSQKHDELVERALDAMKLYSGNGGRYDAEL